MPSGARIALATSILAGVAIVLGPLGPMKILLLGALVILTDVAIGWALARIRQRLRRAQPGRR